MDSKPSCDNLQTINTLLDKQIETVNEKTNYMLYDIANIINTTYDLEELYQSVYDSLNKLIPLPNFFIALYDNKNKIINFDYFIDEYDDDSPIIENLESPNCLTGEVLLSGRPLFLKENVLLERAKKNRVQGAVPKIWLGVPMIIQGNIIGAICVQSYTDPDYFSHKHLELLVCISEQIAIAIDRRQLIDDLKEKQKLLNLITDNTRSIVIVMNSQGIYESVSPAHKPFGYDFDLPGTSFFDLIHKDDIKKIRLFLEKGIAGIASHITLEFRIKDKSDIFRRLDGTFDLLRDEDGIMEKIIFVGKTVSEKKTEQSPNWKPETILVIDDEDGLRDIAVKALKSFGYSTLEACDGEIGLSVFKQYHHLIDVVLLDIIMPKMSGMETFKQMLEIDPHVKVIIASGHVVNQDQKKMFAKACAYLEKPYQIMELKKALQSILN